MALHHALHHTDSAILAVNGPPGTGKTTLIQSLVATYWVSAAVDRREPPIIVATGATNQSVRNVIESFTRMGDDQTPVLHEQRWIPDVPGFGLVCTSERAASFYEKRRLPVVRLRGGGFPTDMEDINFVWEATTTFLEHCSAYFGDSITDISTARDRLHHHLTTVVRALHEGIASWTALTNLQAQVCDTYGTLDAIEGVYQSALEQHTTAEQQLTQIRDRMTAWQHHLQHLPWWLRLLDLLIGKPVTLRWLTPYHHTFMTAHNMTDDLVDMHTSTVQAALEQHLTRCQHQCERTALHMQELHQIREQLAHCRAAWDHWYQHHGVATDVLAPACFDQGVRTEAFYLTMHYWEACWLLEQHAQHASGQRERQTRIHQVRKWRRYAKLTPCFVTNFFMLPAFFSAYEGGYLPLIDFIDLLILDEAAQARVDVAGAAFALAKQAIVIGDCEQLQPIYALQEPVDQGNMQVCGVADTDADYEVACAAGVSAVTGSAMVAAQRASAYQLYPDMRGMFLREHRRCVPEIIAYCNELAYRGRLQPHRESLADMLFPALGYAHIPGVAKRLGGSRANPIEAHSIAQWVDEHQVQIEDYYQRPLDECLAIVTPFARQVQQINQALRKHGVSDLTVGTVHVLQGAEMPIVIFSPVYHQPGRFFFDKDRTMLNVAVSRAKDSFLVFGHMGIFEPYPQRSAHTRLPSSLLARYLFADEGNEVVVMPPQKTSATVQVVQHLTTLDEHREVLAASIYAAQRDLRIVSPVLSIHALRDDGLPAMLTSLIQRGIPVTVYTDDQLNRAEDGQERATAREAKHVLAACGVQVQVVNRVHNKTICVDERILIEGSFNWLAAQRQRTSRYHRREASLRYEGPGVEQMIRETIAAMEQHCLNARDVAS
ncbi:MAG: hypothetical protein HC828_04400 [Blastochloris sp.]|nr:hypothetical protein [Blastochloris sp.]